MKISDQGPGGDGCGWAGEHGDYPNLAKQNCSKFSKALSSSKIVAYNSIELGAENIPGLRDLCCTLSFVWWVTINC